MVDKSYGTHKQKYCVLNGGALVLLLPSLARRHSNKAFVYFEINLKWLLLMCMCMQNGSRDLTSSAGVKMDMRTEPTGAQAMPVVYRGGEGCQSVPCSTFMASRRSCHFAVSLCHSLTVPPLPPPHLHDLISTTPHPPTPDSSIHHYPPLHGLHLFCRTNAIPHSFRKSVCCLHHHPLPTSPLLPCLVICGEQ